MKKQWLVLLVCFAVAMALCLAVSLPLTGQSQQPTQPTGPSRLPTAPTGSTGPGPATDPTVDNTPATVRLYACRMEDLAAYEALAQAFTLSSGIDCQVVTGDLTTLMASDTAPTIFCLHSQAQAEAWQHQLLDLTGSDVLEQLYSPAFALTMGEAPVALAMDITGYGIIYNASLLAQTGYTRTDITSFASFTQVVEAITQASKRNNFSAFCCPDLTNTDLVSMLAGLSDDPSQIRAFLDLYINNDTAYGKELELFLGKKTVFYVGGAWEYGDLSSLGFHNLDILPFYTENGPSFPCTCSTYWAVNSQVAPQHQQAALQFLSWLVTRDGEGNTPVDSLGFFAPFRQAEGGEDLFMRRLLRRHLQQEPATLRWSIHQDMDHSQLLMLANQLQQYVQNPDDAHWETVEMLLKRKE